jgi:1-acyl-sn-glycerol-3-phosphate acyltransferase
MDLSPSSNANAPAGQHGLWSASFLGLLATQLLTAMNDNIFRWLVIGIGKQYVPPNMMSAVIAVGTLCFLLPYIFLAAPSGYLADRFSKRTVVVYCKWAEVVCMTLGVLAIILQSPVLLFTVVALVGAQSALFAPAKLGCIPEMLRSDCISAANGLMGLITMTGTVVGMALGNILVGAATAKGQDTLWLTAPILIGAAVVGSFTSMLIEKLPAADPKRQFPWGMISQMWRDLKIVNSNAALLRIAIGLVFYWSIALLAQVNIDQFAYEGGTERQAQLVPLLLSLVAGVAIGNVLAGIWSEGRVELGILPLGAGGMALAAMLLFTAPDELVRPETTWTAGYIWACVLLFFLGQSAGLFEVPLNAYLQHRSPHDARGSVLAATNMLMYTGMLAVSLIYLGLRAPAFEGSLTHIDALKGIELTAAQEKQIDATVAKFAKNDAGQGEHPLDAITPLLKRPPAERQMLLARLVWEDLSARKATKEGLPPRDPYVEPFPEKDQPLVRHTFDEVAGRPLLTSKQIFLLCGMLTIPVFIYIIGVIPQAVIRFVVWLMAHTLYRIKLHNRHYLPDEGGALLVANHVSWLDGILLLLISSRPIRMIVYAGNFKQNWLKWMANLFGAILMGTSPKAIVKSLQEAREALNNGELVCIFPEGGITRSGQVQAFRPGAMKILQDTNVPVIPIYLDELWGSIFSFSKGRFFWKWPRGIPYPISIYFGPPIDNPDNIYKVRQAVQKLGASAVQQRTQRRTQLVRTLIRQCKRRKFKSKIADSTGNDLTGGSMLMRALILRRLLRRHVLAPDEKYVGILLPPSVGGAVVNASLAFDRRVSVNLNYTVSNDVMNVCIKQAGIKHVLTSRKFMEKFDFQLDAEVVYLEDFKEKPTLADKVVSATHAYATPTGMLYRMLGLHKVEADDPLTVIFTSGSTGEPKGVVLTHGNVASNVEAIDICVRLTPQDVLIGILPFFHSFGYTVTFWTLCLDVKAAYHFNPLDARQIGKLTKQHKGTVLLSTPTFLRGLIRRCEKDELQTLDVVVTGAEKLPKDIADAFEQKFGHRPVEGYGCTELSPLASVNIPPSRSVDNFQPDRKEGTVGRPVPGVCAMINDIDTGVELGVNEPGMLMIKGPNVMQGYLNRPDLTEKVIKDGWYNTGDIAFIDDEGFIHITGRLSRFSKIGGEMVPHIKIEEKLNELAGTVDAEHVSIGVSAVPDEKKGERLIVLHTKLNKTPQELCAGLSQAGFPNLFIPGADDFFEVEHLPVLGTGKLDLRALKEMAVRVAGNV